MSDCRINNRAFNGYAKFTKANPFETKVPIDISFIEIGTGGTNQIITLPDIGETITFDGHSFGIAGYAVGNNNIYAFAFDLEAPVSRWIEWDYNNSLFTNFWSAEITENELLMHSRDGNNTITGASFFIGLLNNDYVEAIDSNWLNYSFLYRISFY